MRNEGRETSTDQIGKESFPYETNDSAKIYRMNEDKQGEEYK